MTGVYTVRHGHMSGDKGRNVKNASTITLKRPVAGVFPLGIIWLFRVLFFISILLILYGSLSSGSAMPSINNADKVMHLLAYGGVTWFAIPAFSQTPVWKFVCILMFFGVGIEIAQNQMNLGRQGSLLDVYANIAGIVLGVLFWLTFNLVQNKGREI